MKTGEYPSLRVDGYSANALERSKLMLIYDAYTDDYAFYPHYNFIGKGSPPLLPLLLFFILF